MAFCAAVEGPVKLRMTFRIWVPACPAIRALFRNRAMDAANFSKLRPDVAASTAACRKAGPISATVVLDYGLLGR